MEVCGKPLVSYPLEHALSSKTIDEVAISTDSDEIASVAQSLGATVIERPAEFSQSQSQMIDAITHALKQFDREVEIVVTMHGNCAIHSNQIVDRCVGTLKNDPSATACVSGVINRAIHPYRLRELSNSGTLEPWFDIPKDVSSNRQDMSPCVILDGAARAIRVENGTVPKGHPPFPYLGEKVLFEENPEGFDIHSKTDVWLAERWITMQGEQR